MKCLVVTLLLATAAARAGEPVESVVLARATGEHGGVWVACGTIHAIGWGVYERVRVIEGADPGPRFAALHSCPADAQLRGELRLSLTRKKPALWPEISPMPAAPYFWALAARPEVAPETKGARRWLGAARADVDKAMTASGADGEWTHYGGALALRYVDARVVAVRAQLALGVGCEEAAEWLGFVVGQGRGFPLRRADGCQWPGTSDKHRLGADVVGSYAGGVFELTQKPAR